MVEKTYFEMDDGDDGKNESFRSDISDMKELTVWNSSKKMASLWT